MFEMDLINGCEFCNTNNEISEKVIYETDYFRIVIDRSYITEGHVMIISKSHYGCVGELPKGLLNELIECKNFASQILMEKYKTAILFYEHGRAGSCLSKEDSNGVLDCNHQHFHLVPSENINLDKLIDVNLERKEINLSEIGDYYEKYGAYLYFEEAGKGIFYIPHDVEIPPHYLRTLISSALGVPERADWRHSIAPDTDLKRIRNELCFRENVA